MFFTTLLILLKIPSQFFRIFPEFFKNFIFSKVFLQFLFSLKIIQNIYRNGWKIYLKSCFLFLRNSFVIFFEDFQIFKKFFSQCYSGVSNFYNSAKFLPNFLKTIAKFFRVQKFHHKFRHTNFCPQFFQNFDNNSKLQHNVCKTPSRKPEVFLKFHKNFSITLPLDFKMAS